MAGLDGAITMAMERRPCYVDGKKAMFHCWTHEAEIVSPSIMMGGHSGGVVETTLGIIENEDGSVETARPQRIRFADVGNSFKTAWNDIREDTRHDRGA